MPEFGAQCVPDHHGAHEGGVQPQGNTQPAPKRKELWRVRNKSRVMELRNLEVMGSRTPVPTSRGALWRNTARARNCKASVINL